MDQDRSRIQEDLRGQLDGEVLCDDLSLQLYSMDASIHSIRPTGIVRPANLDDVVKTLQYASESQLAIHPRGSGSNFVGASLGSGLILDFAYLMRRQGRAEDASIVVQAGALLASVNKSLQSSNQQIGPDPVNLPITTIGGMCGINASGSNWLKYGSMSDNVLDFQFVLADGTVINTWENERKLQSLLARLDFLGQRRGELIKRHWPKTPVNSAGYFLPAIVTDQSAESWKQRLVRLLCGSEGTLGVITEVRLRTWPIPAHRAALLLFFDSLATAANAAVEIANRQVAACDLLDRRILTIARDVDPLYSRLVPEQTECLLLIEIHADNSQDLSSHIDGLLDRYARRKNQAFGWRSASHPSEREWFCNIARQGIPGMYKLKGRRRALPFLDDCCVPQGKLPSLLLKLQTIFNQYDVTAVLLAHAGQGIVRAYPLLDLANAQHLDTMRLLSQDLYSVVIEMGGTISGSHGDGYSRSPYLHRQYGHLTEVLAEVKQIFDPNFNLNPGKIVVERDQQLLDHVRVTNLHAHFQSPEISDSSPNDRTTTPTDSNSQIPSDTTSTTSSSAATQDLAPSKSIARSRIAKLSLLRKAAKKKQNDRLMQLNWEPAEALFATRSCNGCGRCRTNSEVERMCPIFRVLPREEASPRAKANLMRGILTGTLNPSMVKSEEFKSLSDLCVNCHQCRLECPAKVDIPKLMVEAKAQYVAVNGLGMSHWLLTRLDLLYEFGGRFPGITNWLIRTPLLRWCVEKFFGVAQARKLPSFAKKSFMRWAAANNLTKPIKGDSKKVLYFVDAFANWNDPELARATVKVLKHNGFNVYVPAEQLISGMSMISAGLVDRVKKLATRNVELLAEAVRQGYQIVTTEPSAALALQHEYLNFLEAKDAKLVAEHTIDINKLLWNLHQQGQLALDFSPLNADIGYHLPCHQKALKDSVPGWELLRLIPGLKVETIEKGCSGMAGTYGLMSVNYRRSLRVGLGLINSVRSHHFMAGSTECSTCRIQMEQGTSKPTIHPVKILALSYGLDDELQDLFGRRSQRLVLS
ncbi:MAG TPA: anaerobic glycerol-3-phosphate dehydrogenase subunit C [Pirellulaceae bacterium]|nr:anaerobic glycerol-3-phosphate dehydrogenase subunit C [Pirellulaceae bacterium]HMO93659.1 anaerobic glycerol-3-phosphate dehydrogenase subunit C [Pirellulaceae bacterium]HMP70663.1 anaerobic glycerol-3-phosphate dehydrogenase subunit C [Pirellulaceae bacterium]